MSEIITHLHKGSVLQGNFKIERVLGQGGFGITYLATDLALDRLVAVKEFFPKEYCNRDVDTSHVSVGTASNADLVDRFKAKFLKEARNIAKFDCPYIIKIITAFEANGTAYYVMEYIEGESLSEMVKREGPMDQTRALGYIEKVGLALEYLHDRHHMNHLDVKPANVMVRRSNDTPVLIDFGLSKQYTEGGHQTSTTPVGISHGYAPIEQYTEGGVSKFSPTTDIYSLAATLYYLLTGKTPVSAPELQEEGLRFPAGISRGVKSAIEKAMAPTRKYRHQHVREFIADLRNAGASPEAPEAPADPPKAPSGESAAPDGRDSEKTRIISEKVINTPPPSDFSITPDTPQKPWYLNLYVIIGAAVVVAGLIVWLLASGGSNKSVIKETVWADDSAGSDALTTELSASSDASTSQATPVGGTAVYGGHTSVDLGLSVNWADCNLGASSPSDYGNYYDWGVISPGFTYSYSHLTSSICGNASYDAATASWGSGWRMPSSAECRELLNKCSWQWTSKNGVRGYQVTGPSGNSIFLPGAGYYKEGALEYCGSNGNYWSGSPNGADKAYYISFQTTDYRQVRQHFKDRARSIRPVRAK